MEQNFNPESIKVGKWRHLTLSLRGLLVCHSKMAPIIVSRLSFQMFINSCLFISSYSVNLHAASGGYPPRRQSMSITSLGPIPTPGIPPAAIGLPPNQPSRRQSLSAVPPRGPPPLGQLGMKPPDGVGPNSLNRRVTVPQLPKGLPPRGPPPRGPPPRGPPHGPPGFNNDRSSLSGKLFLEGYTAKVEYVSLLMNCSILIELGRLNPP